MNGKDSLAIVEGTLIDGTGKDPVGNSAVLVQNGKISNVGPMGRVKIPSGVEVISASGFTVMPGIIDAHVHFMGIRVALGSIVAGQISPYVEIIRAANDAKKVLAAGVTSVADAGSPHAVELKKAVNEKEIPGPRFFVSGHALTQTGGHGDPRALPLEWARGGKIGGVLYTRVCDGVDEVRRVLREQIRNGADFAKFMGSGACLDDTPGAFRPTDQTFSFEEMQAICQEAHMSGRIVHAHAETNPAVTEAINAGANVVIHGFSLDEETCDLMVERDIILIPTLGILKNEIRAPETPQHIVTRAQEWLNRATESATLAYRKGVKIGVGSDTFGPPITQWGGDSVWEVCLMVEILGMEPMEAIVSATKINSKAVGAEDEIGTLEKGKLADLLVLRGNPLDDINILMDKENIQLIMKEGEIFKKAD